MDTKACSLTENEIEYLISYHGCDLHSKDRDDKIERINYLNRRLKAFKEEAPKVQMIDTQTDAINAAAAANPVKDGW